VQARAPAKTGRGGRFESPRRALPEGASPRAAKTGSGEPRAPDWRAAGVACSAVSRPDRREGATALAPLMFPPVTWERPAPADVWRAVEAYLALAYDGAPPAAVAERVGRLRAASEDGFYACDAFERGDDRYALRLGNRFYPHMKLVVLAAPGGRAVFRADTHDRHLFDVPGVSSPRFAELMARNEALARAIEDAWSASGLLTAREHLRDQVASWRASRR
jgi:hypothetical protein